MSGWIFECLSHFCLNWGCFVHLGRLIDWLNNGFVSSWKINQCCSHSPSPSAVRSPIYLRFILFFWRSGLSGCHAGWCREHPGGGPVPAALGRGLLDWWDHWRAGSWTPRPPRPHPGGPDGGLPQVGLIFTQLPVWGPLLGILPPPPPHYLTGNEFPIISNKRSSWSCEVWLCCANGSLPAPNVPNSPKILLVFWCCLKL